jgi:hypothetical protein
MKAQVAVFTVGMSAALAAGWFVATARRGAAETKVATRAILARQMELRRANLAAGERLDTLVKRRRELAAAPPARALASAAAAQAQALDPKMAAAMAEFAKTPFRDIALEKNPALQVRYLASRRAEMMGRYGALWAKLGLTDAQIDRFVANLAEAAARDLDINATRRAQGLEDSDPVFEKLRAEATAKTAAAQRELLGDDGYRRLAEFEAELPVRGTVDGIATRFIFYGTPLSAEQTEQLVSVMLAANAGYRRDGRAEWPFVDVLSRRPAREVVDSAQVLERSRAFLTPEQHALLELQMARMPMVYRLVNLLHESSPDPVIGFTLGR